MGIATLVQYRQHIGIAKLVTNIFQDMGTKNQSHLPSSVQVTSQRGCHLTLASLMLLCSDNTFI
jgi:hypothetical protein